MKAGGGGGTVFDAMTVICSLWTVGADHWPPLANENDFAAIGDTVKTISVPAHGLSSDETPVYFDSGSVAPGLVSSDGYLYLMWRTTTFVDKASSDADTLYLDIATYATIKGEAA